MPTKKKVTPKVPDQKPKYAIGQKVFAITYHKGKPEEIWEVLITNRIAREHEEKDLLGKKTGIGVSFSYVGTTLMAPLNLMETEIYPSFVEAAKYFAKGFLFLLK